MSDNGKPSTTPDGRFENVLAEILLGEEAGKPLDLSRVVRTHPDLETRLREFFRDRDGFDRLAPKLAPTASRTAGPPAPPDLPPGSQFAGYDIVRELGRGGMGVIYLARQRSANRLVALKLIRRDRLEHLTAAQRREWLTRFRTEGQAAARVADDRVVTVYEVGAHDGRPFYSMRYVEGRSLDEDVKAGPLPNRRAVLLMEQVARAVQAIHEQGVLHRDLKPANILVDARGRPYVTDFGLAKWSEGADSLTQTGEAIGSAPYMSPEQAQDAARVSAATDVYGLGATLYALLTGRPPFQGTTVAETLHQVKYREPTPPRRVNPAVDRDLNTIALACLEKEPGRRYRSAAEVADELQRYLKGRPIRRRPVGPGERLWRWSRRNPVLAAVSAAALVLVTLAGTLYLAYLSASGRATAAGKTIAEIGKKADEAQKGLDKTKGDLDQEQEHKRALAYLEDMGRGQQLVNGGELTKARELLAKWRHEEGKIDLRAWEWYFLDAQCREAPFTVRGHQGQVQAVAWSPDGERLASADRQGVVKVWRLADGGDRPLFEMPAKIGGVAALAWSPDGEHLAGARQGIVQLWEAASGKEEQTLHTADNSLRSALQATGTDYWSRQILVDTWIVSLAWSTDSRKLALFDANGKVQFWDLTADKDGSQLLGAHAGGVHAAAWSPDGKRLASVGGDGQIKVWDLPNPKARDLTSPVSGRDIVTRPEPSYALTWADDKRLNVVSGDGDIRTLDAASGEEVAPRRRLAPRDGFVQAGLNPLAPYRYIWGPGGKLLASVAAAIIPPAGGDLGIWDASTGKELFTCPSAWSIRKPAILQGPESPTGCAPAWDPSGQRLALGADDGVVKTLYVGPGRRAVRTPVLNVFSSGRAWSRDGRNLLCAADLTVDDLIAVQKQSREAAEAWQKMHPGPGIGPPPNVSPFPLPANPAGPGIGPPPNGPALPLPANPVGPGAPYVPPRPRIQVCDAITGEVRQTMTVSAKPDVLAESPDGKWLAAATSAGLLQVWPAAGGDQSITLEEPPKSAGPAAKVLLAWSSNGVLAYSTPHETSIRLWDSTTRKPLPALEGHGQPLRSLAWSPDGKRLASAADDGTGKVWDVTSGKAVSTFTYFVVREPPRFGLGGKTFASSILAWSHDGKLLAVAGEDETIRIWDVDAQPAEEIKPLPGHPSNEAKENHNVVCTVAWSPDGKRLAAASPDGTFLVWDTATWQEVLTLRPGSAGPFAKEILPSHAGTLAWSPDGWQLGFFSVGGAVTIWDATPEEGKSGQ